MINNLKIILDKKFYFLFLLVFGMVISATIEIFSITLVPIFISSIIDFESFLNYLPNIFKHYIIDLSKEEIIILSALFIIFSFILKSLIVFSVIYFELKIFKDIYLILSNKLFKKYVTESYSSHIKRNKSEIIRNINEEVLNTSNFVRAILIIARESSVMIGAFILVLIMSGIFALPGILIILFVCLTFIFLIKKKLKNYGTKSIILREELLNLINYGILSFKVGKILNLSSKLSNNFKDKNIQNQNYLFFQRIVSALPRFIIELLAVIILLGICIFLILLNYSSFETISLLALISLVTIRMIPAFQQITGGLTSIKFYKPSFKLISKEIDEIRTEDKKINNLKSELIKKNNKLTINNLTVENLSFKYESENNLIFKNLSITFNLNQMIGIYGKSGSGKTTFADILMGLLENYDGKIFVDKMNIKEVQEAWKNYISYVPQETFLINDSIENNITFGEYINENTNLDFAINLSMTSEIIKSLAKKEKTIIGKDGFNLSGGQKQRVGIARALFKKPKFLILDESTNSLDSETQNSIIGNLKKVKNEMTIIIISHDFNVIKECDHILHFNNNKIDQYENPKSFFYDQGLTN